MNDSKNIVIIAILFIICLFVGFTLGKIDEIRSYRTAECTSQGGSMITYNGSVICAKVEKLK